jgi:hypothetical protein
MKRRFLQELYEESDLSAEEVEEFEQFCEDRDFELDAAEEEEVKLYLKEFLDGREEEIDVEGDDDSPLEEEGLREVSEEELH